MFRLFHVYLFEHLCYLNMSIKDQYETSDGAASTEAKRSVCVCS